MEWITFVDVPTSAGSGKTLEYAPLSATARPLFLIALEASHVDSNGAVDNSCSFTLRRDPAAAFALKRGWMMNGSLVWSGRIPMFYPLRLRATFGYANIDDTLQLKCLVANRGEVF